MVVSVLWFLGIDVLCICVCVFNQNPAYEMRISDLSSDVCSSDLRPGAAAGHRRAEAAGAWPLATARREDGDDLPGADDRPQPGHEGRRADRRGDQKSVV